MSEGERLAEEVVAVAGEAQEVNSRVASAYRGNDLVPSTLWLPSSSSIPLSDNNARECVGWQSDPGFSHCDR